MQSTKNPPPNRDKFVLYTRCCDGLVTSDELHDMYDTQKDIAHDTFVRHVQLEDIPQMLGYVKGRHAKGLRLKADRCVSYTRALFKGLPCYVMDWSSIDHLFLAKEDVQALLSAT